MNFLDPACGSGNFLTETYLSLRKLENKCIETINAGQTALGFDDVIKVSIGQFYGIEINDFAVTVAKTALWIAESQMMKATEDIVHMELDFLPLKSYANIVEANALRIDWNTVIPKEKLHYIMGNPPFVGYTYQTPEQKNDLQNTFSGIGKNIDYVAAWYFKAAEIMQGNTIRTALVSTNSITQGEQVASIWKPLYGRFGVHIDFAYRTFRWDSEANIKAHVHCVIIGFSTANNEKAKLIFENPPDPISQMPQVCQSINAYLADAPCVFIEKQSKPVCNVPVMTKGSQPTDGGFFIVTEKEYDDFLRQVPDATQFILPYLGAEEFINNKKRYCLWLKNVSPHVIQKNPLLVERINSVRKFRLSSKKEATKKQAATPTLFTEDRQPASNYIAIPEVSSERRIYVPMGFLTPDIICSNKLQLIPNATLYHFGILTSIVHMSWMRTVCGRLEMRYDYSGSIVYNNFPWCEPTDAQKSAIEKTAQAILDARALYPDCSLADLYDEATMPPELRKAHQANDRAVMKAYGYAPSMTEPEIVADLMKRYQELTAKEK